ncbi:MAG: hypothetical protein LBQ12_13680 [Deltaproteobacteria bacterium]|nr:hypothetical protein [Deltaproteobacteria bacterium]
MKPINRGSSKRAAELRSRKPNGYEYSELGDEARRSGSKPGAGGLAGKRRVSGKRERRKGGKEERRKGGKEDRRIGG